jgi:hypothetical protein
VSFWRETFFLTEKLSHFNVAVEAVKVCLIESYLIMWEKLGRLQPGVDRWGELLSLEKLLVRI